MQLLSRLQELIGGIYDVRVAHDVYDFLVTDRAALPQAVIAVFARNTSANRALAGSKISIRRNIEALPFAQWVTSYFASHS